MRPGRAGPARESGPALVTGGFHYPHPRRPPPGAPRLLPLGLHHFRRPPAAQPPLHGEVGRAHGQAASREPPGPLGLRRRHVRRRDRLRHADPRAPHRPAGAAPRRRCPAVPGTSTRLHSEVAVMTEATLSDHALITRLAGDTPGLAEAVLERFGTAARALAADPADLALVPGISDGAVASFATLQAAVAILLRRDLADRVLLSSWSKLLDYLRATMAHGPVEVLRVDRKSTRLNSSH